MSDWSDLTAARAALAQPGLPAAELSAIVQAQPSLGAEVAAHPAAWPALVTWIGQHGDARAQAAAAQRLAAAAAPAPAPAAPPAVSTPPAAYAPPAQNPYQAAGPGPYQAAYAPPANPYQLANPNPYQVANPNAYQPTFAATPRHTFTFVMSILLIVGGSLNVITSIVYFNTASTLAWGLDISVGAVYGLAVLALVFAVVALVAGVRGVKNARNPAKAPLLVTLGAILVALAVLVLIFNLAIAQVGPTSFLGLVVPVLFLVAAIQFKNQSH
ncbi:MAG: hypothetical protein LBR33_02620 [Propionibacteriaceae bacterium]|jgi:hypothetical protein|nr:hypothetical protein [Propionibacteriaceae bacterium]